MDELESKVWNEAMAMKELKTPSYLYSPELHRRISDHWRRLKKSLDINVFYSVKAQSFFPALEQISDFIDGVSVSSKNEMKLAQEVFGSTKEYFMTSPGISSKYLDDSQLKLDFISCNSREMFNRLKDLEGGKKFLLRVNPEISVISDPKYNPCRKDSHLGQPLSQLDWEDVAENFSGIHFHSHSETFSFESLGRKVEKILDSGLEKVISRLEYLNFGGGYLVTSQTDFGPLERVIAKLKNLNPQIKIILEPGNGLVIDSFGLITEVVDKFTYYDKEFLILDTTVNHLPQIFEYQYKHPILGESPAGTYKYSICGSSCLAGDRFGEYLFEHPKSIGDRILFPYVGSYSNVKAHTFNGISLPYMAVIKGGQFSQKFIESTEAYIDRSRFE